MLVGLVVSGIPDGFKQIKFAWDEDSSEFQSPQISIDTSRFQFSGRGKYIYQYKMAISEDKEETSIFSIFALAHEMQRKRSGGFISVSILFRGSQYRFEDLRHSTRSILEYVASELLRDDGEFVTPKISISKSCEKFLFDELRNLESLSFTFEKMKTCENCSIIPDSGLYSLLNLPKNMQSFIGDYIVSRVFFRGSPSIIFTFDEEVARATQKKGRSKLLTPDDLISLEFTKFLEDGIQSKSGPPRLALQPIQQEPHIEEFDMRTSAEFDRLSNIIGRVRDETSIMLNWKNEQEKRISKLVALIFAIFALQLAVLFYSLFPLVAP